LPEAEDSHSLKVLLDQNVPRVVVGWLHEQRPGWQVVHVSEVGLYGKSDKEIYDWAQANGSLIITFDEDFADQRPCSKCHSESRCNRNEESKLPEF